MCGIAGILSNEARSLGLIEPMRDRLVHRGPDDAGAWQDAEGGIALGHRRLSIVDLSPHGHQPMVSADGRWVLSYNGEIYNHLALRKQLEDRGAAPEGGWRGTSDTETLLQLIAVRGLDEALSDAVGMFAFALWDRAERRLFLARDRLGEKPLYYGHVGRDFVFASELKALYVHPQFDAAIAHDAVETFVARTYIPAPLTIFRRIFALQPGCILAIDRAVLDNFFDAPPIEGERSRGLELRRYWNYAAVIDAGLARPIRDEREAMDALEASLADAIRGQSIADVPVGVFLSGGLDSSAVTALYQKHSSVPVRSFTIGFAETGFNEAEHARQIAAFLGTTHEERTVSADDAMAVIPSLGEMFDQPFADSSQIPTYLVSQFAHEKVTVALSGDGGDELLCGYSRYADALKLWRALKAVPKPLRRALAGGLSAVPPAWWHGAGAMLRVPAHRRFGSRAQKAVRVGGNAASFADVYASLLHQWPYEAAPTGGDAPFPGRPFDFGKPDWPDAVRAMYADAVAYLPDDILTKVDRASMAVSLETRAPLLDHRVAEVAARIPLSMKVRGRRGKMILRSLLAREIPSELFDRPKAGFALPIGAWLRGPLRDWAEGLLDPSRMREEGWFDPDIVQRRWKHHLDGQRASGEALWAILMFQSWLRGHSAQSTNPIAVAQRAVG